MVSTWRKCSLYKHGLKGFGAGCWKLGARLLGFTVLHEDLSELFSIRWRIFNLARL